MWLISWLHQSEATTRVKIRPPRMNGDRLGVFATRGPHRPNPIGLTLAAIQKVDRRGLWLQGMDLIDGTPILDIKPYVSRYDSAISKNPPWIDERAPFTVEVADELLKQLEEMPLPDGVSKEEFIQLAKDSLIQDPRPPAYKERHHELYYLWLYDLDVECQFDGVDKFRLLSVRVRQPEKSEPS